MLGLGFTAPGSSPVACLRGARPPDSCFLLAHASITNSNFSLISWSPSAQRSAIREELRGFRKSWRRNKRLVHGGGADWPAYLPCDAERIQGDVRDPATVRRALADVQIVFHLAAAVGVGQSMYRIEHYVSVNSLGAAVLLEAAVAPGSSVERLVVASSMSVYGEGAYVDARNQAAAMKLTALSSGSRTSSRS